MPTSWGGRASIRSTHSCSSGKGAQQQVLSMHATHASQSILGALHTLHKPAYDLQS